MLYDLISLKVWQKRDPFTFAIHLSKMRIPASLKHNQNQIKGKALLMSQDATSV